jgi:hypothetical protein
VTDATYDALTARMGDLQQMESQLDQMLEEAVGTLRNLTQLQEPGWTQLGSGSNSDLIAGEIDRQLANQLARWYYLKDPTASQAVMLHNAYTFARGVSIKAKDERIQGLIKTFWDDPRNRHSISRAAAQWAMNTERQLEGELFLGLFVSTITGRVTVRLFDPSEFPESNGIITMPGDPTFPIYFRREFAPRWFDFAEGAYKTGRRMFAYYPDYRNAGADLDGAGHGQWVKWDRYTEVYVMHICTNPLAGRGLTHLNAGLPWLKALKGFMEDRATLTLALATFAFKQKVKGNRQAVQRVLNQWGTYETSQRYGNPGDDRERRQGANTWVENDGSTLEQLKTDSGSSNAYQDMRMFRQMAGLGSGHIFEHYLGDPSTGNLATSTAMELPLLKMFEFEQQVWEDVIGDLSNFVVVQGLRFGNRDIQGMANIRADIAGGSPLWVIDPIGDVDLTVTATLPPIVQSDVAIWGNALASIAQSEIMTGQQIVPPEQKAQVALNMLGIDDIGQIIDVLKADGFRIANLPAVPDTATGQPDTVEERLVAAFRERYRQAKKLHEAEDEDTTPDVGKALPKDQATKVEPVTRSEVDQVFDDFENWSDLDALLDELGLSIEDVDD